MFGEGLIGRVTRWREIVSVLPSSYARRLTPSVIFGRKSTPDWEAPMASNTVKIAAGSSGCRIP